MRTNSLLIVPLQSFLAMAFHSPIHLTVARWSARVNRGCDGLACFVPTCDIDDARRKKRKAAQRRLSKFNSARSQARRSSGLFCLRRYAMKPTPAKPRIIIAHVEGSGTALVNVAEKVAS